MRSLVLWMIGLGALLACATTPAQADNPRYAAFVVDEGTGEVLHARRADARRYPASLTKMMTLYMLFEAIESGDVALTDSMTTSRHAANQSPSRLGVPVGDTIETETAIRALVIRSANDVAVIVAEHLAGTERAFANQMTSRARDLGLTQTTFRNASGLPNSRQTTTARDMARLATALRRDFPQYAHYFEERSFRWDGRTYRSHNNLVGRVDGVDGLKTGYIRASGFNIAVTAGRDGRRIIAVVMGGPTAASRDTHAERLVNAAFRSLASREQMLVAAAELTPRLNPIREQDAIAMEVAALNLRGPVEQGSVQSLPALRIVMSDDAESTDTPVRSARLEPPIADTPRNLPAPSRDQGWAIQVGAYAGQAAAQARLETVRDLNDALSQARAATPRIESGNRQLYRARFEALSAETARSVCRVLAERGEACFAVAPGA
jgi:D-alanyl-D-alanine carboxypeptidase